MTGRRWRLGLALLALLAVGLHFGVINHSFTYDDHIAIEANPTLESPLDFKAHFTSGFWGPEWADKDAAWRPFTTLTLSWNRAVHGLSPGGVFAINALLHGAATVLLALLAVAWGVRREWAFAAAVLFAVHPLHIEAIAPGVGRADLLMAAGSLLALLAWERGRLILATCALALAMLSKEMGSMIALVIVWRELTRDGFDIRQLIRAPLSKSLPPKRVLLPIGVFAAWLLARYFALGAIGNAAPGYLENALAFEGLETRVLTAGAIYTKALELFVAPFNLAADYSYAAIPLAGFGVRSIGGLLLLLATVVATVALARKTPLASAMMALWIGPYLLVSHLGPTLPMIFAERVLYLPSAGLCLLVGFGLGHWRKLERFQKPATVAIVIVCALFAWRSHDRLGVWKDDATLWLTTAQDSPRSVKTLCNVSRIHAGRGDYEMADELALRALGINDRTAVPRICLAEVRVAKGDAQSAAKLIAEAVKLKPDPVAFRMLECAYAARFRPDMAVGVCESAAARATAAPPTFMYLGIAYDTARQPAKAEAAFRTAIEKTDSNNAMVLFNYGSFLANNRRLPEAVEVLAAASDLVPENPLIAKRLARLRADVSGSGQ